MLPSLGNGMPGRFHPSSGNLLRRLGRPRWHDGFDYGTRLGYLTAWRLCRGNNQVSPACYFSLICPGVCLHLECQNMMTPVSSNRRMHSPVSDAPSAWMVTAWYVKLRLLGSYTNTRLVEMGNSRQ